MRIAVMRWYGAEDMKFVQNLAAESGVPLHVATISGRHYLCITKRFDTLGEAGFEVARLHRSMEELDLGKGRIYAQEKGDRFLGESELVLKFENQAVELFDQLHKSGIR